MTEHRWYDDPSKGSALRRCANPDCTVVWPPYLFKPKSGCKGKQPTGQSCDDPEYDIAADLVARYPGQDS